MTSTDFLIVYLACGAPFGVHFFLQQRAVVERKNLWLKTVLAFVFWLPLAFSTIRKMKNTKWLAVSDLNKKTSSETAFTARLSVIRKNLESFVSESDSPVGLFEFRRTIERYANLTILRRNMIDEPTEFEREIFRTAEASNVEIAAFCLHRRNRKRLAAHQIEARKDFLQMIENLASSLEETDDLRNATNEFVRLLEDSTARDYVEKLFVVEPQTVYKSRVGKSRVGKLKEEVLWKPQMPEPLHIKTARRNLTARMNLRDSD